MSALSQFGQDAPASGPFVPGALVIVYLASPREKFWGMLLNISPAGLSVRGLDLNSFDDFLALLRAGEPASPGEVFFPMHRLERIEVDASNGDVPSIADRFQIATGHSALAVLGADQHRSVSAR